MELCSHVEGLLRVNSIGRAKAVVVEIAVCQHVKGAITATVAVVEDTVLRRIALVAGDVEGVFVGLHDVKLGTPVAAHLVGITILEGIARVVEGGHRNCVESRQTVAVDSAQVDVKLEDSAEKIDGEKCRGVTDILCR